MTILFNALPDNHLGYAAVFLAIAIGFLFLRAIDRKGLGPGYWALSFLANSLGFLFWSQLVPIPGILNYALGELCHILGFFLLVCGAYRFTGRAYKAWNLVFLAAWLAMWGGGLALLRSQAYAASLLMKGARSALFAAGGLMLLRGGSGASAAKEHKGRIMAGISLIVWAAWIAVLAFVRFEKAASLAFGVLVGMQVLAAMGLIMMVVEGKVRRLEQSERKVERLEGLLPICSHCKKIRGKDERWHVLEHYIEKRSGAEFSHSVCPECMTRHYKEFL